MKILMVTNAMNIGGAETHILELTRELSRRGHTVTVASNGGVYADELDKIGVKTVSLPLNTKNPASVLRSLGGLKKLLAAERFDIVHAHARIPSFLLWVLNECETVGGKKFRFVTTAHLNFTVNPLWRKISRWGERVMAVSDDIADYLVREYAVPRERIYTTINGIDTDKFSPSTSSDEVRTLHGLSGDGEKIVYMSRLDEDRAEPAYRLLEIAQRLGEKYPQCEIVIVGGGRKFDELNEIAGKVNKKAGRNLVTMTGAISNTNEYCALSDVFIGVSRSALEAMSSGKPVIMAGGQGALGAFDKSKVKEAINTNFCCRGHETMSAERMYEEICVLLDNRELRDELGAFGREFVMKNYTAARMADDYLAMYEDTLRSPVRFRGKADIVLSGYYGFGNLGDESLLDIIAATASEKTPGIKIAALTRKPKYDKKRTGLKCVSRFNMPRVMCEVGRARVLVSGGGSLLQDKTSKRSLRYYAGIMRAAELMHKKVYVYANGIGPIIHERNRELSARAVRGADIVSVRDGGSLDELRAIGCGDGVILSADPAFLISERISEREKAAAERVLDGARFFAMSVRLMDVSVSDELTERDEEILDEVTGAAARIAEEHGLFPLIIPMQESRDTAISEKLRCCLAERGVRSEIYKPASAGELISVLRRAEFMLGMRLHAIIFATCAGTPVIGLSYDPKVASFMAELGQKYVADLSEKSFEGELVRFAAEILLSRDATAGEITAVAEKLKARAGGDVERLREMVGG